MDFCGDCLRLENRLCRANDHYVSLILQEDRMVRDGNGETVMFTFVEDALHDALNERSSAAGDLLAHRQLHADSLVRQ